MTATLRQTIPRRAFPERVLHADFRPPADEATGTTLVFSNSLGTDLRLWDAVVAELPSPLGLLRYDTAGEGLSGGGAGLAIADHADDLAALVDHFALRRYVLVGLSVGGLIAQTLAGRAPRGLRGVVLANTGCRIGSAAAWAERVAAIAAGGMEAIADATMERWFSPGFRAGQPDTVRFWRTMLASQPADGYRALATAIGEADCHADAARITVPTLCIAGGADTATPKNVVAGLAAAIPGARLVEIPEVGHLPPVEAPGEMARLLAGFVGELLAGQAAAGREPPGREDPYAAGLATRRAVLGEAHVARARAAETAFEAPFQDYITRGAWGTVWSGEAISRRERSMITIALLAALGHEEELAMHCRACARTGAGATDIREALMHVAVYAGVPAANRALRIARAALAEAGIAMTDGPEHPEPDGEENDDGQDRARDRN